MENEEPEIKSKQASKRDRTLIMSKENTCNLSSTKRGSSGVAGLAQVQGLVVGQVDSNGLATPGYTPGYTWSSTSGYVNGPLLT